MINLNINPNETALFLDFDGTLVEIAETPSTVQVDPGLPGLLQMAEAHFGGALAIVSGRPVREIDEMLAPNRLSTAGLHGLERRYRHGEKVLHLNAGPDISKLRARIQDAGILDDKVALEDKGGGLALHYRQAPDREAAVGAVISEAVADLPGLTLLPGKMVFEAKAKGISKGHAVEAFMGRSPFAGRRPVFVGDDRTDEDAFYVINVLNGISIKVGNGETAAQHRLVGVGAVHALLSNLVSAA